MKLLQIQSSVSQTGDEEEDQEVVNKKRRPRTTFKLAEYRMNDSFSSEDELPIILTPVKLKFQSKNKKNCDQSQTERNSEHVKSLNFSQHVSQPQSSKDIQLIKISRTSPLNTQEDIEKDKLNAANDVTSFASSGNVTFLCNGCKNAEELLPKLMEKLEAMSDDIKYLILCQQTSNNEIELKKDFESCSTKNALIALENSLCDEGVFRSTLQ